MPFKKGYDPNRNNDHKWKKGESGNVKGRGANKTISQFLKEFGRATDVTIHISRTYTTEKGKIVKKEEHYHITDEANKTINAAIAARMTYEAMNGGIDFIREILNRTEGRVKEVNDESTEATSYQAPIINIYADNATITDIDTEAAPDNAIA